MSLALLLALVLTQAVAEQGAPLAGYDPARLHAEAVFSERTRSFLDDWLRADEAARTRARAALAGLRRSGAPATSPPSLPAIARAQRALTDGGEGGEASALQVLADSLDLRATPGFFAARPEGLGELITVRLRRLWPAPAPPEAQVTLWWLAPAGRGEALRARSEPAAAAAFEGAGFEMFVRPPVSGPGDWRLVVELESAGERVRGVPVLVQCLADAAAAVGLAREVLEGEGPALELARGLLACARGGARLPAGLAPASTLELLRERLGVRLGSRPRPVERSFRERDGRDRWVWTWLPVERPRVALVLIAPSHEPPQAAFGGEAGRLWRDTAKELSALLLVAHLPRGAGAEELSARLARLAELARELGGELPVALVARGDALDLVQRGLAEGGASFAALIAVSPREGAPRSSPAGLPTLLLAPGGPPEPVPVAEGLEWVHGEPELLLDEALLPGRAGVWLRARLRPDLMGGDER